MLNQGILYIHIISYYHHIMKCIEMFFFPKKRVLSSFVCAFSDFSYPRLDRLRERVRGQVAAFKEEPGRPSRRKCPWSPKRGIPRESAIMRYIYIYHIYIYDILYDIFYYIHVISYMIY